MELRLCFTRRQFTPKPDAISTLTQLRDRGYKIGLISDCTAEVPTLWSGSPFAPLVDVTIFSCSEGITKPDPRIYQLACDRLSVSPEKCAYIGDGSGMELTGASTMGMCAVLVRCPEFDFADVDRTDAKNWSGHTVKTLSELLKLVE